MFLLLCSFQSVMDGFKKEVERRQEEILKQLTPVKSGLVEKSEVKSEKERLSEKKNNWLSSAQLWVDNPSSSDTTSEDKSSQEVYKNWRT